MSMMIACKSSFDDPPLSRSGNCGIVPPKSATAVSLSSIVLSFLPLMKGPTTLMNESSASSSRAVDEGFDARKSGLNAAQSRKPGVLSLFKLCMRMLRMRARAATCWRRIFASECVGGYESQAPQPLFEASVPASMRSSTKGWSFFIGVPGKRESVALHSHHKGSCFESCPIWMWRSHASIEEGSSPC